MEYKLKNPNLVKFNQLIMQITAKSAYIKSTHKIISLTVDLHYHTPNLERLLKIFLVENIEVTFFLTGQFCKEHPTILPKIINSGYEVGSHSYSHPHLTQLNDAQIIEELQKTEDVFFEQANISPKPLFRAPYGETNKRVLQVIRNEGYNLIGWTLDICDSLKNISLSTMKNNILSCNSKDIILMHTTNALAIDAIEQCIPMLKKQGYTFQAVSKLFN